MCKKVINNAVINVQTVMIFLATVTEKDCQSKKESNVIARLEKYRSYLVIAFMIISFVALVTQILTNSIDRTDYWSILKFIDWNGISSLFAFIAIAVFFRLFLQVETEYNKIKELDKLQSFVVVTLAVIGFFGLWFTIRSFGLILKNSITLQFDEVLEKYVDFNYAPSEIFKMLGYILTARLCFNLMKTFSDKQLAVKPKFEEVTPKLLETLIFAIIIGLIVFIPRYSDSTLLDQLGGSNRVFGSILYVVILIALIGVLLMLIRFRNREFPEKPK
jgi:hypothetical protein